MSAFSDVRRAEVAARAGHRCEYCRLPTRGQVATFPIDHIVPRRDGGTTDLGNLALTCPHCNAHKWTAAVGTDPDTGGTAPLFNPRLDDWDEHFAWAGNGSGVLIGATAVGRATIANLRVNDADMIALRVLLAELGLFPEARVRRVTRSRLGERRRTPFPHAAAVDSMILSADEHLERSCTASPSSRFFRWVRSPRPASPTNRTGRSGRSRDRRCPKH